MRGKHVLLQVSHFLLIVLIINVLYPILPTSVSNNFLLLCNLVICVGVTKLTLGISKKIFFSERLKPDGKAVLITGCARGIGHALARHLYSRGFHVFASCRDTASPGARELRKSACNRLQVFPLDVADDESVREAMDFVKDHLAIYGVELWAIINNAGIQKGFLLELTSMKDFRDTMEVNVLGSVRVTKAFLPLLRRSKGRVINIASMIGRLALPMTVPYTMSKFACVGFSESLRYELDLWGVQVISIEPEFFDPDMTREGIRNNIDAILANADEQVRKDYGEEFIKEFKLMASTIFQPSSKMQKLVETIERAVILRHPDAVYKVCRNRSVRVYWILWDALSTDFKDLFMKIVYYVYSIPKLGHVISG